MNKNFKIFISVWAILLILFNVLAFVSFGLTNTSKYTESFWIGYAFITIAFIGHLICAYFAFKDSDIQKTFYNISPIMVSNTGLIVSFVLGVLCMLIAPLPYWVGVVVCMIALGINAIAVIGAKATVDEIVEIDKKVKEQTFFIKALSVDAKDLISKANSAEVKKECSKVYEVIRYSDPMSNDALAGVESEITIKFADFSAAVNVDNLDNVKALAKDVIILVEARNKKCGLLK